jgi:hypothetical protein
MTVAGSSLEKVFDPAGLQSITSAAWTPLSFSISHSSCTCWVKWPVFCSHPILIASENPVNAIKNKKPQTTHQ